MSRGLAEGCQVVCSPLCGVECRGHSQYPAFAPDRVFSPRSSEVAIWFFGSFCIFLFIICPNCACMHLFLAPYSFFIFCCLLQEMCVQVQVLHCCGKQSQVPDPIWSHLSSNHTGPPMLFLKLIKYVLITEALHL